MPKVEIKRIGNKRPPSDNPEANLPINEADWQMFNQAKSKFLECVLNNDWKYIPRIN
jgi:hypothetical protein